MRTLNKIFALMVVVLVAVSLIGCQAGPSSDASASKEPASGIVASISADKIVIALMPEDMNFMVRDVSGDRTGQRQPPADGEMPERIEGGNFPEGFPEDGSMPEDWVMPEGGERPDGGFRGQGNMDFSDWEQAEYIITDSTRVSGGENITSIADIKEGDMVTVTPDPNDTSKAFQIVVSTMGMGRRNVFGDAGTGQQPDA